MLRLRKIEPSDLPFLYQWENDAAAWADGNNHNPLSQQDLRAYIASTTGDIYRDGQLRLIIEDSPEENTPDAAPLHQSGPTAERSYSAAVLQRSGHATLGCIDLFDFDPRNRKAAIGLYVAPDCRGRGVGREALRLLEHYAFDFLALRLLYAVIGTKNTPCSTLFQKADYTPSSPLPNWTLEGPALIWTKCFD